ncbi:Peptidase M20 [Penicillium canariense]|uniref:Peptidase M20 n=1 Tax=Penicillium canariense TaxID=189055 RepID=A0A9W9LTA7_9EURO|nr:Peptidase M20 [Penicillium canariense]KAJ5175265.1 Peptidase M20 [Penicillium canariense]
MKASHFSAVATLARVVLGSKLQYPIGGSGLHGTRDSSEFENIIASSPLLAFHKAIVEISSISGDEKNVGEFVLDFLSSQNFTVEKQIVAPETGHSKDRFNIYAYVGDNRYPDVLLTSHIDTVPPFIPYSLHPPSSGAAEGPTFNRTELMIAGRGTVDAKASVAAIIFAAIETLHDKPDASVGLLFDVGEEKLGTGMKHFSDSDLNPTPSTFHTVIFGEPTELSLVAGHKGSLGLKVIAKGKAAHSGYPWLGQSAISSILPLLSRLDNLENILPENGGLLRSDKLGKSTLNIGEVHGGVAGNVVPAYAEALVSVRLAAGTPDDTREILQRAVEDLTGSEGNVYLDFGEGKAGGAPPQHFDVDVPGFDVTTVNYGTDAASLHIHDQGTKRVRRYLYGPGSIHVAHGDNEAITVGELEEAVDGYKRLISAAL